DTAAVKLIQELKSRGIPVLGQAYGPCLGQLSSRLRRSRRVRIVWLVSGQRSNSGASTSWDAPSTSLSCPDVRPHTTIKHPLEGVCCMGGCRAARTVLLSRDRGHSSMVDCHLTDKGPIRPRPRLFLNGAMESPELVRWKDQQEAFQEDNRLAQTGIQVVL